MVIHPVNSKKKKKKKINNNYNNNYSRWVISLKFLKPKLIFFLGSFHKMPSAVISSKQR